ncbi:hypothetical protein HDE_06518 [Halotydeus destructor]|nr:hypothetical protein HDE_06518 [Halotydeus destructor]
MPQGKKLKAKARLPPKVRAKTLTKSEIALTKVRKGQPKKVKHATSGQITYKIGEKAIRAHLEDEVRSQADHGGGRTKGSAGSRAKASSRSVKDILRNLKK